MQSNLEKDISRMKKINTLLLFLVLTPYLLGAITTVIRNKSQLPSTVVYTNQANTYTTGLQTFLANNQTGAGQGLAFTAASSQGAPTSGSHAAGEHILDSVFNQFLCIATGSPGTWRQDVPSGTLLPWTGNTTPTGYGMCDGHSESRTGRATLFANMVKSSSITCTSASPGVITWTSHGLFVNDRVKIYTTGSMPTGITESTGSETTNVYYVASVVSANTFTIATTPGGSAINTSSTGSSLTAVHAPFGDDGENATTFKMPDLRGRVIAGPDGCQGRTAAGVLTSSGFSTGTKSQVLGESGGTQTHTLTTAQLASHSHGVTFARPTDAGVRNDANQVAVANSSVNTATATEGSSSAHPIVQPTLLINYIIKF